MQLHQLLRFLTGDCHIILFNLNGQVLAEADKKSAIPIDFYEYDILQLASTIIPNSHKSAICIMLQK